MFTLLKLLPIISQLSQPNISLNKEEFLAGMESVPFQVAYYGPPTRPVIRLENPTSHERLTVIIEEELNPSEVNHKWLLFSSTNLLQKPITTTASRAPLGDEVREGKQFVAARFSNLFACSSYWGLSTKNTDGNTTENNPNAAKPQQILELI